MNFPTPNHCGLTWDVLHHLVACKLAEGTIVGDDGDGWLVAYLEGHGLDDQPDDLVIYYSYAQDYSDWSIGNENWTNLSWTPNTPRDHHWYAALPHPKQFTDRNSSRVDGIIIAYTDRASTTTTPMWKLQRHESSSHSAICMNYWNATTSSC